MINASTLAALWGRKANDTCHARFHSFLTHRLQRDVAAVAVTDDKVSSMRPAFLQGSQVRDQMLDRLAARSDRIPTGPQELLEPDRPVHRLADRPTQRRGLRCPICSTRPRSVNQRYYDVRCNREISTVRRFSREQIDSDPCSPGNGLPCDGGK